MAYYRLIISLFIFSSWQGFAAYKPDEPCPFCSLLDQEECICPPSSTANEETDDTSSATAAAPTKRKVLAMTGGGGASDVGGAAKHNAADGAKKKNCSVDGWMTKAHSGCKGKCWAHDRKNCSVDGCIALPI